MKNLGDAPLHPFATRIHRGIQGGAFTLTVEKGGHQTVTNVREIDGRVDVEVGLRPYVPANAIAVEISRDAGLAVALEKAPDIEMELN